MLTCPECLRTFDFGPLCPHCDIQLCQADQLDQMRASIVPRAHELRRRFRRHKRLILLVATLLTPLLVLAVVWLLPVGQLLAAAPSSRSAGHGIAAVWVIASFACIALTTVTVVPILRALDRKFRRNLHALGPASR
jgi:uncharacterized BrkB/YihY/UPF0761 family membrane protein